MVIYDSYKSLPRPQNSMPGPPPRWASISPSQRHATRTQLEASLASDIEKSRRLSVLIDGAQLPESAVEDLGDNDIVGAPSAVLVPFILGDDGDSLESVLVMTRSKQVSTHKGQVSFPGGMIEETDSGPIECALRETEEEIGIPRSEFKVLGIRDDVYTRTKLNAITPVIAICNRTALGHIKTNDVEVDRLHEIKVSELIKPDVYASEVWDLSNLVATIHMYFAQDVTGREVFIWGATAHILTDVLHCSLDMSSK